MAAMGGLVGGAALNEELRRSNVVRLKGISFSATVSEITEFFKSLALGPDGVVICVNLQGRCTGQAYVQFVSAEVANMALEWNRQRMGGRYIDVSKGHPADMQGALRMVGRGSANRSGSGSIVSTGIPGMGGNPDMRYTGIVRVRGMPYSSTSADITAFFKGLQIVPDGIFINTHANGRPNGEAFVEFVNDEMASQAMQLQREPMGSRYVDLYRCTKGDMMTAIQQRMYGLFAGLESSSNHGLGGQGLAGMNLAAIQAAGLGITIMQGLGDLSEHVCIKMRGLPFSALPNDIMDFFEGYKIAPNGIHIVPGVADRPTGEAFVEFVSKDEAHRAMQYHPRTMGGRFIELFRATKSEFLVVMGSLPGLHMGQELDPSIQLLLLQQQAAAGAFGMGGLMGVQAAGSWAQMQNVAAPGAHYYPRQAEVMGSTGGAVFDPSSGNVFGAPYRSMS